MIMRGWPEHTLELRVPRELQDRVSKGKKWDGWLLFLDIPDCSNRNIANREWHCIVNIVD